MTILYFIHIPIDKFHIYTYYGTSLVAQMVKHLPTMRKIQVRSLGWEDPLETGMAVFLPGESHGQRGLVGYSLWVGKESDTTE